jgi:hypothetical protein
MDFVRLEGLVMYAVPAPQLGVRIGLSRIVSGRNVGQSTTLSGGLFHTFHF